MDQINILAVPQIAPPLVFEDGDGAEHALSEYRGRFVLLNVWATWCASCAREMPSLDALQNAFDPRDLLVLPLSENHDEAAVLVFYRAHVLTHAPVAIDAAGRAPRAFRLNGLPTSLVIDPAGREIARIEGNADWASPEALDFLRGLINRNRLTRHNK